MKGKISFKKRIRRIFITLSVLLIAYINLNMYLSHQISCETERIRKEEEIINLSDLCQDRVRQGNRASLYLAAAELVLFEHHSSENIVTYYNSNREVIKEELAKNEKVFLLMDEVLKRDKCNFEFDYEDGFAMMIPNFLQMRNLAHLLATKAIEDMEMGNYDKAVERCAQCLAMGKDLSDTHGAIISHMMGLAIANIGIRPLEYMMENGVKADYAPAIKELNNIKSEFQENFVKSLEAERAFGIDHYDRVILNGQLMDCQTGEKFVTCWNKLRFPIRPYMLADKLYYIRYMSNIIDKVQENPSGELNQEEISKYYIFSQLIIPGVSKASKNNQVLLADCDRILGGLR